jgi:hypothetical protein
MKQAEFERHVGAENICSSIADALERAADLHKSQDAHAHEELARRHV